MDYLTYRWTNIVQLFYTTYISVDLAQHEIFHAKVGKGGIMDASFWFNTNDLRWSIINVEGSQVLLSKQCFAFLSLYIFIVSANTVDPDEMPHYAVFHLGLHCLLKFTFWNH